VAQNCCETPSAELSALQAVDMRELTQLGATCAQRVNPLNAPKWNETLPVHPDRSFFHLSEWAKVLHETYRYSPCYFTLNEGGLVHGMLPIMEVDSWLSGRRGVGLPFTDLCNPLVPDSSTFQKLVDYAVEYGVGRGWKYLELRGGRNLLPSAPASQTYYGHELNLGEDEKGLFAGLKESVRRAIRKAEKLGLTVEILKDLEAMREFYTLQCRTRKKHGLPPQPFRFFLKIQEHILSRGKGVVVLARQGRSTVAGAVFFHSGEQAIFKYGASNEAQQGLRGNDLVMWEALKYYAARGFRVLHLGRTSLANAGLRRFKLAWGAREQIIEYVRYDLKLRAFVAGKDDAFGWHNRVFRLLPIGVLRLIGTLLYRHAA
jgi:hypothetical protein